MLYPSLLAVHILCVIFWGGGAIIGGFFFIPSVLKALQGPDPAAGVAAGLAQYKYGMFMGVTSVPAVLSGLAMYSLRVVDSPTWVWSAEGACLGLGGLLGLGAFVMGLTVLRPMNARVAAIAQAVRASGGVPTAGQAEDWTAAQSRSVRTSRIAAWHLIAAALLMSLHGLVRLAAH